METILRLALYILYFKFHEQAIFYWGKIISIEISSQLSNFKDTKKFHMASYLIFSITYFDIFKGLNIGERVNCNVDPVTMWYQSLWRKKIAHYFYEVYNEFVFVFKKLVFGGNTSRLSQEALTFMNEKGIIEEMKKYNIMRIYFSHEKTLYLPYYVLDRSFVVEVERQYKSWLQLFYEKNKKHFFPQPWKVGEIFLRGTAKIDEYAT
jgi:hypothetical protein